MYRGFTYKKRSYNRSGIGPEACLNLLLRLLYFCRRRIPSLVHRRHFAQAFQRGPRIPYLAVAALKRNLGIIAVFSIYIFVFLVSKNRASACCTTS